MNIGAPRCESESKTARATAYVLLDVFRLVERLHVVWIRRGVSLDSVVNAGEKVDAQQCDEEKPGDLEYG